MNQTLSALIPRLAELEATLRKEEWKIVDKSGLHIVAETTGVCTLIGLDKERHADFIALLRNSFPALLAERQALREALEKIMPFRAHNRECEVDMTEFCTCGLKEAADQCRAALALADKPL